MAIDLAVALTVIAARALVAQLIKGTSMDQESWAETGADIVGTLVNNAARPRSATAEQVRHGEPTDLVDPRLDQLGQQSENISKQIGSIGRNVERIGEQVDDLQARDFDRFMRVGSRYMRDLPVKWRTDQDRRELSRDARRSFVDAVAVAEQMGDAQRQATAEVAIAGCWLWVPSIEDVRNTIGHARRILEHQVLFGPSLSTQAYVDVLELCLAYRERPPKTPLPARTDGDWRRVPESQGSGWLGAREGRSRWLSPSALAQMSARSAVARLYAEA